MVIDNQVSLRENPNDGTFLRMGINLFANMVFTNNINGISKNFPVLASSLYLFFFTYHALPTSSISMCVFNSSILFCSLNRSSPHPHYLMSPFFASRICPGYSIPRLRSRYSPKLAFSVENVSSFLPLFQPHAPSCLSFDHLMLSHVPVVQDQFLPVRDESPQLCSPSPFTPWFRL